MTTDEQIKLIEHKEDFRRGYDVGFDAGAASVDRVQIVREAFGELDRQLIADTEIPVDSIDRVSNKMDAVLEAMEAKGND